MSSIAVIAAGTISSFEQLSEIADVNPEEHVDRQLRRSLNKVSSSQREVICRLTRIYAKYRRVVKVVVDGYFNSDDGRNCLRSHYFSYVVLTCASIGQSAGLTISDLSRLAFGQDVRNAAKFLRFLFNSTNQKWMQAEWCKIYDRCYVNSVFLEPLESWHEKVEQLLEHLQDKLESKTAKAHQKQAPTEPKPFKLTRPRPKLVPAPEKIPKMKPSKPVPLSTFVNPPENELLAKRHQENAEKAEALLHSAELERPSCATAEKSEKTKVILESIIAENESKLDFNRKKASSLPDMSQAVPIKLNAATIMREGALIHRKEDEEARRLAALESGDRDASEFLRWKTAEDEKELQAQLANIERRHLEGLLSFEQAVLARQQVKLERHFQVLDIKAETKEMMEKYAERRLEQEQEAKRLVELTMQGHQSAKDAKLKLQQIKHRIVAEVARESQELLRQALEEAEAELRRKMELIAEIRAMASVPIDRTKFVDLTSTVGHGLLCEMSVTELRDRLELLKAAAEEEEEKRRKEITAAKQAKEQLLQDTMEAITRHRQREATEALIRQEKQKQLAGRLANIQDAKVLALQEKLKQRKEEREKLRFELATRSSGRPSTQPLLLDKSGWPIGSQAHLKPKSAKSQYRVVEKTRQRAAELSSRRAQSIDLMQRNQTAQFDRW